MFTFRPVFEALLQILCEGYKEAQTEFATASDPTTAREAIAAYRDLVDRNQVQGDERNIDWWRKQGWVVFQQFVFDKSQLKSATQTKRSKVTGNSIIIKETSEWLIVIPIDKDASCYHGKNTDWCTTKPYANHFERYFYENTVTLVYFLQLATGSKWAIAVYETKPTVECFNQNDIRISQAQFKAQTGFDVHQYRTIALDQSTRPAINNNRQLYNNAKTLIGDSYPFTVKRTDLDHALQLVQDNEKIAEYVKATGRDPLLERLLLTDPKLALSILKYYNDTRPSQQLEKAILHQLVTSNDADNQQIGLEYIKHVNRARWPEFETLLIAIPTRVYHQYQALLVPDGIWATTNTIDTTDPTVLANQAIAARQRWVEAEPRILTNANAAFDYCTVLFSGRWPPCEAILLTNPRKAAMYAIRQIKGRWIEGEQVISTDPTAALLYVNEVLHKRWPEAEHAIASVPSMAVAYNKRYNQGAEWPELEAAIIDSGDAAGASSYMINRNQRWGAGEQLLLQSGDCNLIVEYTKKVLKSRWVEAESIILDSGNTREIELYATTIIRGRWPECEPVLMHLPIDNNTFLYASSHLDNGWPELEAAIVGDPALLYKYANQVLGHRYKTGEQTINEKGTAQTGYDYANMFEVSWEKIGYPEMHNRILNSDLHDRYVELLSTM